MNSTHQTPVLTAELRTLLDEHAKIQLEIDAEMEALRPDGFVLSEHKKRKLRLKEGIVELLKTLPLSQFGPVNSALYAKTDAELQKELECRERAHRRRADRVGPGAFELVALAAAMRDVQLEIDRRELEAMFASEEQLEMSLEVAA